MVVDFDFVVVLLAAFFGIALSVPIENQLTPSPTIRRPWNTWALHSGIWLLMHGALTLLLARPWYAAINVTVFLFIIVLVNNAKMKALREPFVVQDFEYFTDAVRHPRLYIPFLGWDRLTAAIIICGIAIYAGIWGEPTPAHRFNWSGQLGGITVVTSAGLLLLLISLNKPISVTLNPYHDLQANGLFAYLWSYIKEIRKPPDIKSQFKNIHTEYSSLELPHLVAVQSESFFDPRQLYHEINPAVLAKYDQLKEDAAFHGKLKVPAWGANTVRTEFSFLSGIAEEQLGVHRFNPYRTISSGWTTPSLASFLQRLGYRTVCVHPYPASFYLRNKVFPHLGFDEFIDIRSFDESDRFGPYISDLAVASKIKSLLQKAGTPIFIFAITMENHGPLHLEKATPADVEELYLKPPHEGCEDLTIYLRHLRNACQMSITLRGTLEQCERPTSLCWYGDHVPIMPSVYETLGFPDGDVDYLIWSSRREGSPDENAIFAHDLALNWLQVAGVAAKTAPS
jgi:hypothetical protein